MKKCVPGGIIITVLFCSEAFAQKADLKHLDTFAVPITSLKPLAY